MRDRKESQKLKRKLDRSHRKFVNYLCDCRKNIQDKINWLCIIIQLNRLNNCTSWVLYREFASAVGSDRKLKVMLFWFNMLYFSFFFCSFILSVHLCVPCPFRSLLIPKFLLFLHTNSQYVIRHFPDTSAFFLSSR